MTLSIGHLITIYVVLAAVLALLNIFSSLSWLKKAGMLLVTSAAYLVLYFAFPPLLGWPSSDALPKRFGLIGVYAQEPDRITGARGNVYFWVTDKASSSPLPRAYQLDYEPELHAQVRDVRAKLNKNVPQIGESGSVTDEPDMSKMGKANEERLGTKSHKNTIKFFDAAPEAPPSKGDMPETTMSDETPAAAAMPTPATPSP